MTPYLVIVACAAAVLFGCDRDRPEECGVLAYRVWSHCDTLGLQSAASNLEYRTTRFARKHPGVELDLDALERGVPAEAEGFGALRAAPRAAVARSALHQLRFCASTRIPSPRRFWLEAEFARLVAQYIGAREPAVLAPTLAAMIEIAGEVAAMETAS